MHARACPYGMRMHGQRPYGMRTASLIPTLSLRNEDARTVGTRTASLRNEDARTASDTPRSMKALKLIKSPFVPMCGPEPGSEQGSEGQAPRGQPAEWFRQQSANFYTVLYTVQGGLKSGGFPIRLWRWAQRPCRCRCRCILSPKIAHAGSRHVWGVVGFCG
jgi:hypothetical protein